MSNSEEEFPESKKDSYELPEGEETKAKSDGLGSKRLVFLAKCMGVSILLGILIYWASEATFRPPAVDSESNSEWVGLTNDLIGRTRPGWGDGAWGPASFVGELPFELTSQLLSSLYGNFDVREILGPLRPFLLNKASGWILVCIISGIVFGLIRARSWRKRVIERQAYDEPIVSQKLRTWLIRVALVLVLVVVVFEIRNGLRRGEREANFQFLLASAKGNVSDVNHWLSEGASVHVKIWEMERFKPNYERGEYRHRMEYIGPARNASKEDADLFGWENRGYNALHLAAREGYKETVELLLSKGANVNEKVDNSEKIEIPRGTPLHFAAQGGHKEIVELLLSKGANVDERAGIPNEREWGFTALHLGIGNLEIVELLLENGANVNAQNFHGDGATSLHQASRLGNVEVVKLLLAKGARVDAKAAFKNTPLHWAVYSDKFDVAVVEQLLSKGADVNAKTEYPFYTPLHLAVRRNFFLVREFRRALESKPDSEAKAKLQAPLDAELKKLGELKGLVELLIAQGAEVNAESHDGTPLDMAEVNELTETVELLRKHGGKTKRELREE